MVPEFAAPIRIERSALILFGSFASDEREALGDAPDGFELFLGLARCGIGAKALFAT